MSPLLRCGLVAAALVGAFAAGFFVKPVPALPTAAAQPPATHVAAKPPVPMSLPDVKLPEIAPPDVPVIHDPNVKPATDLGAPEAVRKEPPDPLDAAGLALVGKELGIKTTILDKSEPVPAVLADARKEPAPTPPVPQLDIAVPPPAIAPVPMTGPTPRLDPPPMPDIPTIRVPSVRTAPDLTPPPGVGTPPPPKPTTLVNTRAVALDFEVTKSGPFPVVAVELWTTRNGGGTWERTDRTAGARSPFRTRLGSDGEYGFRLVFESESGMRTPEPKPGDRPDLRVDLDTTPPRVNGPVIRSTDGARGKMRIEWDVADVHMAPDRVRLEYSTDGRAWVATGFDPTGIGDDGNHFSRAWTVPPGLPHRVMLRLTVADRAGNETTAELPRPVSVDLVAPEGRLTGVRPAGGDVGPMPREVEAAGEPARPFPEAIRGLLPALLASPSVFPPLAREPVAARRLPCGVTANEDPPVRCAGCIVEARPLPPEPTRTARAWVGQLTDTTVVPEPVLSPYRRPDPFVVPAVTVESLPALVVDQAVEANLMDLGIVLTGPGIQHENRLTETPEEQAQRLDAERRRAANNRPLLPTLTRRSGEQLRPFRETAGYTGGRSLIHHLAEPDWRPTTASPDSCRWEYEPAPADFWGTPPLGLWFRF